MYIVKILKRKDAASVVVAIVLALVLNGVMFVLTDDLATYLSGIDKTSTMWRENIVRPLIAAALQLIVLEAILRAVIYVHPYFVRKKR